MAPFSSLRTAWIRVACCRISRGSQGGIQRGEGNWGGEREQFRTSALMSRIIKEELPTEPGRVRRGVDCETDGSWVVENLIVISSLKRASSKWSMQTNIQWTSPFCTSWHFSNHYKYTSKWVVQVGRAISIAYRVRKVLHVAIRSPVTNMTTERAFSQNQHDDVPFKPNQVQKKMVWWCRRTCVSATLVQTCDLEGSPNICWRWVGAACQLTSEVSLPKK